MIFLFKNNFRYVCWSELCYVHFCGGTTRSTISWIDSFIIKNWNQTQIYLIPFSHWMLEICQDKNLIKILSVIGCWRGQIWKLVDTWFAQGAWLRCWPHQWAINLDLANSNLDLANCRYNRAPALGQKCSMMLIGIDIVNGLWYATDCDSTKMYGICEIGPLWSIKIWILLQVFI